MRLSARARYATRIMVCIGAYQKAGPVRKKLIAEQESLSPDYVEQILVNLKNAGLVNSHRGARGGFTISGDPTGMTIADILKAVDGPLDLAPCQKDFETCAKIQACVTQPVWEKATVMLQDYFAKVVLSDLIEEAIEMKHARNVEMYHI